MAVNDDSDDGGTATLEVGAARPADPATENTGAPVETYRAVSIYLPEARARGERQKPVDVLVVGPAPEQVGGMASVVEQMLAAGASARFRRSLFPTTVGRDGGERVGERVRRHVGHLLRLDGCLRRQQLAIVHIHTCSGFSFYRSMADMVVALRHGCRVVLHVHGAGFDAFFDRSGFAARKIIRRALAGASAVIALSNAWRETLLRISPRAQVAVIENAVAIPEVVPRREHAGPGRVLTMARMDTWKGIEDILAACALLRQQGTEFEWTLAGPEGSAGGARELAEQIAHLGLTGTVHCVGAVRGAEKQRLLAEADVYVQASHQEGMPLAVLEAMGWGLPVVATRVGAVPEVLTDGVEGRLVAPRHPPALAEAVSAVLSFGDERRRAMGEAGRARVAQRHSLARFHEAVDRLYAMLV